MVDHDSERLSPQTIVALKNAIEADVETRMDAAIAIINTPTSSNEDIAQAYADVGRIAHDAHFVEDAEDFFQKAIKRDSKNDDALHYLAAMIFSYEDAPLSEKCDDTRLLKAIHRYNKILEVFPEDLAAHMNLSYVFLRLRNYSEAFEHAGRAKAAKPDDDEVRMLYARIHIDIGSGDNYAQAEEILAHLDNSEDDVRRELYILYTLQNRAAEKLILSMDDADLEYVEERLAIIESNGRNFFSHGSPELVH